MKRFFHLKEITLAKARFIVEEWKYKGYISGRTNRSFSAPLWYLSMISNNRPVSRMAVQKVCEVSIKTFNRGLRDILDNDLFKNDLEKQKLLCYPAEMPKPNRDARNDYVEGFGRKGRKRLSEEMIENEEI